MNFGSADFKSARIKTEIPPNAARVNLIADCYDYDESDKKWHPTGNTVHIVSANFGNGVQIDDSLLIDSLGHARCRLPKTEIAYVQ